MTTLHEAARDDALAELERLRRMYNTHLSRCWDAGYVTRCPLAVDARDTANHGANYSNTGTWPPYRVNPEG